MPRYKADCPLHRCPFRWSGEAEDYEKAREKASSDHRDQFPGCVVPDWTIMARVQEINLDLFSKEILLPQD